MGVPLGTKSGPQPLSLLLFFLSPCSSVPWRSLPSSTTPLHYDVPASLQAYKSWHPADHGLGPLTPWAKINISSSKLFFPRYLVTVAESCLIRDANLFVALGAWRIDIRQLCSLDKWSPRVSNLSKGSQDDASLIIIMGTTMKWVTWRPFGGDIERWLGR